MLFAAAAIQQGLAVLNNEYEQCKHNQPKNSPYKIQNPQEMLDDFLSCLVESLPKVVNTILRVLGQAG